MKPQFQGDNEALLNEWARLKNLLSNLQTMRKEREQQKKESRSRSLQEIEVLKMKSKHSKPNSTKNPKK